MEWMEVQKFCFSPRDYAVHLELIAKVQGTAAAENYLIGLSPAPEAWGPLLTHFQRCCEENMTDMAVFLFATMVEWNKVSSPLHFNNLMSMYLRLGQPEKVATLRQEMKEKNIIPDTVTYNLLIKCCSSLNDIEGVERIYEEMKRENEKLCNWTTYSNLAIIYMRNGHRGKAELALQNLQKEMGLLNNCAAYHFLITIYAEISHLENIHLIWKSLKSTFKVVTNLSYLTMLQALAKINDIKELKECYKEWESACSSYDPKLANTAIRAFLKNGLLDDANAVLHDALQRSQGPFFNMWETYMVFYLDQNDIEQALKMLEFATRRVCERDWCPRPGTVAKFFKNIKKQSDVDGAEEFYKLMKKINCVDSGVYEALLKTYVAAGRTVLDIHQRIERDGIEITGKLEQLLKNVCPEALLEQEYLSL